MRYISFSKPRYELWALFVVAFLLYLRTIPFHFVPWDDQRYVLGHLRIQEITYKNVLDILNPYVTETDPFPEHHPLRDFTLMAAWRLGHGAPWSFHLFNTLLHAANTVLLACL